MVHTFIFFINIMKPDFKLEDSEKIILRDYLALERTRLANERTLFAYIRTSLYLFLGGIAVLQLEDFDKIIWLGYVLLVLSVAVLVTGLLTFKRLKKKLRKFYVSGNSDNQPK